VAAGLAWIERNRDKPRGKEPAPATDVRSWLEKRTKAELIDLLLEAADESETVSERLYLLAARDAGDVPALEPGDDDRERWYSRFRIVSPHTGPMP